MLTFESIKWLKSTEKRQVQATVLLLDSPDWCWWSCCWSDADLACRAKPSGFKQTSPRPLRSTLLCSTANSAAVTASEFQAESRANRRCSLVAGCQVETCVFQVVVALERSEKRSKNMQRQLHLWYHALSFLTLFFLIDLIKLLHWLLLQKPLTWI